MSETTETAPRRVLVIDDEAEILEPIAVAFRASGVEVEVLASAMQAESVITRQRFSAIITDYKMPVLDGAAMVKLVRNSKMNKDTPIVVMSSYIDRVALGKLTALGVQAVVVKPFRTAELVSRVQSLFAA